MSVMANAWQRDAPEASKETTSSTTADDQNWPKLGLDSSEKTTSSAANVSSSSSSTNNNKNRERHSTDGGSINKTKWENISINVIYSKTKPANSNKNRGNKSDSDNKENLHSLKSKSGQSSQESETASGGAVRANATKTRSGFQGPQSRSTRNNRNGFLPVNRGGNLQKTNRRSSINVGSNWVGAPIDTRGSRLSDPFMNFAPFYQSGSASISQTATLNLQNLKAAGYQFLTLYPAHPSSQVKGAGPGASTGSSSATGMMKDQPPPAGAPAVICILPPGSDTQVACSMLIRQQIARQVDFYFSPDNLAHDTYLRRNMDPDGWVDLAIIAKFNRVATLCTDLAEITEAVCQCAFVEVDTEKRRVRCKENPTIWVFNPGNNTRQAPPPASASSVSAQVQRSVGRNRTISTMSEPDDLEDHHLDKLLIIAPSSSGKTTGRQDSVDKIHSGLSKYAQDLFGKHDENDAEDEDESDEEGEEEKTSSGGRRGLKKSNKNLTPLDVNTATGMFFQPGPHSAPVPLPHTYTGSTASGQPSVFLSSANPLHMMAGQPAISSGSFVASPFVGTRKEELKLQLSQTPWMQFPMSPDMSSTFGLDVNMPIPTLPVNTGGNLVQHIPVMYFANGQLAFLDNQVFPMAAAAPFAPQSTFAADKSSSLVRKNAPKVADFYPSDVEASLAMAVDQEDASTQKSSKNSSWARGDIVESSTADSSQHHQQPPQQQPLKNLTFQRRRLISTGLNRSVNFVEPEVGFVLGGGGVKMEKEMHPFVSHPANELLQKQGYTHQAYVKFHDASLKERNTLGPGQSQQMNMLYRFWSFFLRDNFNRRMFTEFRRLALEDATGKPSACYGIECLFRFYSYGLEKNFRPVIFQMFQKDVLDDIGHGRLYGLEKFWAFLQYSHMAVDIDQQLKAHLSQFKSIEDFRRPNIFAPPDGFFVHAKNNIMKRSTELISEAPEA